MNKKSIILGLFAIFTLGVNASENKKLNEKQNKEKAKEELKKRKAKQKKAEMKRDTFMQAMYDKYHKNQ